MSKESRKIKDREKHKLIRDERKEKGLCPRCGKERDNPTKMYCKSCREYGKDRRAMFLMLGICPVCGKEKLMGDERMCFDCTKRARDRNIVVSKELSEQSKQKKREYYNNLISTRKENGLCYRCGKRKPADGFKSCRMCRIKMANQARKRQINNEQRI